MVKPQTWSFLRKGKTCIFGFMVKICSTTCMFIVVNGKTVMLRHNHVASIIEFKWNTYLRFNCHCLLLLYHNVLDSIKSMFKWVALFMWWNHLWNRGNMEAITNSTISISKYTCFGILCFWRQKYILFYYMGQ